MINWKFAVYHNETIAIMILLASKSACEAAYFGYGLHVNVIEIAPL